MDTRGIWDRAADDSLAELSGIGSRDSLGSNGISLCGSRAAGDDGLAMARAVGRLAAELELPLVSGYAKGVDLAGHVACIEAGGHTIAVLAEGLSRFRLRRELRAAFDSWSEVESHLTVVSQFASNDRWAVGRAMARNATICELGRVLVAIDPGEKGGTLDAVKKALKRDMPVVIACSNPTMSRQHLDKLEQDGARIVESELDLLAAVNGALEPTETHSPPEQQLQLPLSVVSD